MVKRNPNMAKLKAGYLFPEIAKRKKAFMDINPGAKLINLGVGDTTEPITPHIIKGLSDAVSDLGKKGTYTGYGAVQGMQELREKIASKIYNNLIHAEEIFISDGAKPDTGRLQMMFGNSTVAVQDPSYPVYVDSSVISGKTGKYNEKAAHFDGITYMKCTPENNFFPEWSKRTDIIFFCNPNNPTGFAASKDNLKRLVDFARKNKSIIIYDSAYSQFISDETLPKSIYEIEGAKEVAIEISSFSKPIGFTGVRLGWTIVPKELKYDDGSEVWQDWHRIGTTVFNEASNIVQKGSLAALDDEGLKEMKKTVGYYMENTRIIMEALEKLGYEIYGGTNAPYIWVRIPGKSSWQAFEDILEKAHIVTTPGVGFGPAGEGFVRFSAFGHREDIQEAVKRIEKHLK